MGWDTIGSEPVINVADSSGVHLAPTKAGNAPNNHGL